MRLTLDIPNKLAAAIVASGIGFAAGQVAATSFPSDGQQMHYSGFLADEAGRPQTGTEDITVALFSATSGGTRLCEASEEGVDLAASVGRFRVALPDECSNAVRDHGDVYAQVSVGATTLPRQKLGAAPYAVSARDAQSADFAQEAINAASAASVSANGVTTSALVDASVTAPKIADGAVTTSKLAPPLVSILDGLEDVTAAIDVDAGVGTFANRPSAIWTGTLSTTGSQVAVDLSVDSEEHDALGEVSAGAGGFVAKHTGLYLVTATFETFSIPDQCALQVFATQNNSRFTTQVQTKQSSGGTDILGTSFASLVHLPAGQTIRFRAATYPCSTTVTGRFGVVRF